MSGYSIIRSDRVSKKNPQFPHGGCALYVKDGLNVTNVVRYSNGVVDSLLVTLGKPEVSVLLIYRPPGTPGKIFLQALQFLQPHLDSIPDHQPIFCTLLR